MPSEIKQALKQLRKALNEQREYEMFLRTESAHRFGTLVEKILPLMPLFMSKFGLSANDAGSSNTSQETPPSTAQAAPGTTREEPAAASPNASVCHWFYPSSVIGCGLNMDDLSPKELTCLRHEVTCSGCLAQLRADQEKNPTRAKADAAAGGQG